MRQPIRPTRIAVFHSSRHILGSESSGAGVYEASLAELLDRVAGKVPVEFIHYIPGISRFRTKRLQQPNRVVREFRSGLWEQLLSRSPFSTAANWVEKMGLLKTQNRLRREGVDLVYFTSPSPIALRLVETPYIFTVWDLGHRELPGFPEVWGRKTWLEREMIYSIGCGRASYVVVDSEATGGKLEKVFGLPSERWRAIGLLSHSLAVKPLETEIRAPYIFYPAVQWPHKNHATLFQAFAILLEEFPSLKLVLSGKGWSTENGLAKLGNDLGIAKNIVNLGFVPRDKLLSILQGAEALVMPSLLGPTNLPPLEALQLGVPAVVSDAHDFGEEINSNLVRVSALDPRAWASAVEKVMRQASRPNPFVLTDLEALQSYIEIFSKLLSEIGVLEKFRG